MGEVKTPFADNPLFKQSCEICEAYCGEEHFYGECTKCPIYRMAEKLEATQKELAHMKYLKSWDDYPERMGK